MHNLSLWNAHGSEIGPSQPGPDVAGNRGIGFPRIYDLLLLILTRGRERAYRADVLDLAGVASGDHVLDIGCGTGTQAIAAWRRGSTSSRSRWRCIWCRKAAAFSASPKRRGF
jgi:hypothetical protein